MTPEQAAYQLARRLATKAHGNAARAWRDASGLCHLGYLGPGRENASEACGATWQQAVEDWRRRVGA